MPLKNTKNNNTKKINTKVTLKNKIIVFFLTLPACFSVPIIFSNLKYDCSNLVDVRNLQEQVKKHSVTENCSDL